MDTMLNQGTPSAAGDMRENPTVVAADKRIISPDTQLQIAEMIGYLAHQFLINRPQLARDLNDLLTGSNPEAPAPTSKNLLDMKGTLAREKVQVMVDDDGSPNIPLDPKTENGNLTEEEQKWINDRRNTLMVVAVMIASLTFQAAINPPGGLWQNWGNHPTKNQPLEPGKAVNQDMHYGIFMSFMFFNGLGLVASLGIILALTEVMRIKDRWQVWVLVVTMWICVTSVAMAFIFGIKLVMRGYYVAATPGFTLLAVVYGIVFLGNVYRLVSYLGPNAYRCICMHGRWGSVRTMHLCRMGTGESAVPSAQQRTQIELFRQEEK